MYSSIAVRRTVPRVGRSGPGGIRRASSSRAAFWEGVAKKTIRASFLSLTLL